MISCVTLRVKVNFPAATVKTSRLTITAIQMSSRVLRVSIDSEISDASASESVPSSSTATDITESESSSDISELSDASRNKLSKLLSFIPHYMKVLI